jgi:hypothetical protein
MYCAVGLRGSNGRPFNRSAGECAPATGDFVQGSTPRTLVNGPVDGRR